MLPGTHNFNELVAGDFSVWSNLRPGIDPGQWANLCRKLASLSPGEFSTIDALVGAHRSLKKSLKMRMESMLGAAEEQSGGGGQVRGREIPLVSIGPGEIGGEYQKELAPKTIADKRARHGHRKPTTVLGHPVQKLQVPIRARRL